ncbi:MAG: hypothetical protein ACOX36_05055 [Saccharofermentanales bacterium]|nr:hypothetical protein [Clostridiaceae bacterium]
MTRNRLNRPSTITCLLKPTRERFRATLKTESAQYAGHWDSGKARMEKGQQHE